MTTSFLKMEVKPTLETSRKSMGTKSFSVGKKARAWSLSLSFSTEVKNARKFTSPPALRNHVTVLKHRHNFSCSWWDFRFSRRRV
jgi:hypothetical protein